MLPGDASGVDQQEHVDGGGGSAAIEIAMCPDIIGAAASDLRAHRTVPYALRLQPDTVVGASERVAGTRLPRGSAGRDDVC